MRKHERQCDEIDDKATRLLGICYAAMAASAAGEGRIAHAAAALAMAAAVQMCRRDVSRVAHALMAIVLAFEGRYVGTLGFALGLAGTSFEPLANALMAFHYGLVGLDSLDEPGLGRLASGLAAFNYAVV